MADSPPTWLTPEVNSGAPSSSGGLAAQSTTGTAVNASDAAAASGATNGSGAAADASTTAAAAAAAADDEAKLPSMILFMRLANMGAAALLIACSIVTMTQIPAISTFVLAVYATCGGILICCLETQLKFIRVLIAVNFGFLFNSIWRFLFYVLLGSVAWAFNNLFGKITGCVYFAVAIFNTFILCRYPSYRRMREKIAEEEDKRIEARISKEVKRQAAKQIMGSGGK